MGRILLANAVSQPISADQACIATFGLDQSVLG
jgi:hypothetical protein